VSIVLLALASASAAGVPALAPPAPAVSSQEPTTGNSAVALEWTAPGDDGHQGIAERYDLRYSRQPITKDNFDVATPVQEVPHPIQAGHKQRVKIRNLLADVEYYFALKTVDESGNWSTISNIVAKAAPDPVMESDLFPVALSSPMPNPAKWRTMLELTLPAAMDIHLEVFDVGGRLVRTLANGPYPAGVTAFYWDLRDGWGRVLSPGSYWVSGRLGAQHVTRRITVVP